MVDEGMGSESTIGTADEAPQKGFLPGKARQGAAGAGGSIVDEIEKAVKGAAGNRKVVLIRIVVGRGVSVSRIQIAKELHARFPHASLEISDSKGDADSVLVRDIEVE